MENEGTVEVENAAPLPSSRPLKRKRNNDEENGDLEQRYWRQLASEDAREQSRLPEELAGPSEKEGAQEASSASSSDVEIHADSDENNETIKPPEHETLAGDSRASEIKKAARTVFLSNVSTAAITSKGIKKQLENHLTSFSSQKKNGDQDCQVESIRFRSTAFAEAALPRKASFVTKSLKDATTKATNAYVVYTSSAAAREACQRLNGTVILGRHLRVDSVAHPAKQDHRRCVFVGNLGFVDDESAQVQTDTIGKRQKQRAPADVEEGLWQEFGKAGKVENVRVIRDKVTRVGKGFAYVQFYVSKKCRHYSYGCLFRLS